MESTVAPGLSHLAPQPLAQQAGLIQKMPFRRLCSPWIIQPQPPQGSTPAPRSSSLLSSAPSHPKHPLLLSRYSHSNRVASPFLNGHHPCLHTGTPRPCCSHLSQFQLSGRKLSSILEVTICFHLSAPLPTLQTSSPPPQSYRPLPWKHMVLPWSSRGSELAGKPRAKHLTTPALLTCNTSTGTAPSPGSHSH